MPDFTAPFHRPEFTTEEFEAARAKHTAEYGYKIRIPGLEDIIHLEKEIVMTEQEKFSWKRREYDAIAPERREKIREMKAKRRDRYLGMLASPTPNIMRNAGSIMCALDDAQDALTTLSVIGRIAINIAPRILGKAFLGPVGWILTAADIINLGMTIGRMITMPMVGKRLYEQTTEWNPFSRKSRVKRGIKLQTAMPSAANLIEVAQTADNIFGVGLCLGPIVGLIQDAVWGTVRKIHGGKVDIMSELKQFPFWTRIAQRQVKSAPLLFGTEFEMTDEESFMVLVATYLSHQECLTAQKDYLPLDHIADIGNTIIQAPIPTNILTLEVIEEAGIPLAQVVGWPGSSTLWETPSRIMEKYSDPSSSWLRGYMKKHEHDWYGYAGGSLSTGILAHVYGNIEGEPNVMYDFTERSKWAHMCMSQGIYIEPYQVKSTYNRLFSLLESYETEGWSGQTRQLIADLGKERIRYCGMSTVYADDQPCSPNYTGEGWRISDWEAPWWTLD